MSRVINWFSERSTTWAMLLIGAVILALLVLGGLGFFIAQDVTRGGEFPPRSVVAGVDVSGLSKQDAVKKCEKELLSIEQKPVMLTLEGASYGITPPELGLHLNYDRMVGDAYKRAWAPNIFERMFRSMVNRPKSVKGALIAENDPALLAGFVQNVTTAVNQPPRNAYVDVTSGAPVIVPSRAGYQVDGSAVEEEVITAENSKSRTVEIKAMKTPAQLNDDIFHKLIIIDTSQHLLTLYDREQPLAQYRIACGQPAWPTPAGQWQIVSKQMNPTWINPHSAWSASMPDRIGPGYSNPLGLRAMALNAAGVLIHGTSNDGSIGTSASHGCIRMHMPEVIQLFDMVEVGTPVYIIRGPGNPGFNPAETPAWRLQNAASAPAPSYTGD
jgi:lipoprotein-anchoring transpeptidase ErfK/SrfK